MYKDVYQFFSMIKSRNIITEINYYELLKWKTSLTLIMIKKIIHI